MEIAVATCNDKGLTAEVASCFGRAEYFTIVNLKKMTTQIINNSGKNAPCKAGIESAQIISKEKANKIIAGNFGPLAFENLDNKNELFHYSKGTVKIAIEEFEKGNLKKIFEPTVEAHSGLER